MKMSVDQAFRKARGLSRNGDRDEAERLYREILERFPGNRRALEELTALAAPRIENPPQADLDALVALYRQGRFLDALAAADALVERFPDGEILRNLAGAFNFALGRFDAAIVHYDHAIALAPDYFEALNNRGNARLELSRPDAALADFDAALRLNPDYAQAYVNRGGALDRLNRADEALESFARAIALQPRLPQAHNNRVPMLRAANRLHEALASVDEAIRLNPAYAEAHVNRASILQGMMRLDEALESLDRAILHSPRCAEAHYSRGVLLRSRRRLDEACASLKTALDIRPDYPIALCEFIYVQSFLCDWSGMERIEELRRQALAGASLPPFHMLTIDDDPARQLVYARTLTSKCVVDRPPLRPNPARSDGKIRIGYFSADFHGHAAMQLTIGMFERIDRSRFEIHAFSFGPDRNDAMRQRLVATFDAFHDIGSLDNVQAAQFSRTLGIDIAVDLTGLTERSRIGIFAYGAAPRQVSFLGFCGTMGVDFFDHIIADRIVIPEANRAHFAEKVAYLPNCYFPNDDNRAIAPRRFTRGELGLPEQGFVFCCFNNNYKITPVEYDIWMRLLHRVEGSVLWLLADNPWAAANLRREAQARGVDPARIVFAPRVPPDEHLARHSGADLVLDTFKVNAHTTACDALWTGVPVVTKLGNSMVARVAGSLLHALDMPELVTQTDEAYEALAFALATDPVRFAAVRAKLAANRLTMPLFDTARYTRDTEALYEQIHAGTA